MDAEIKQFIDWQAENPNTFGFGTIGQAWARSGREKYGAQNIDMAKQEIARHAARQTMRIEAGVEENPAPWATPVAQDAPKDNPGPFVVG